MSTLDIEIPVHMQYRSYQWELVRAMREGCKRAMAVWHRRAGKDDTAVNINVEKMLERAGTYYYFLPTYAQAKKVIWDGIRADGKTFISHFPEPMIIGKNETEMKIVLD